MTTEEEFCRDILEASWQRGPGPKTVMFCCLSCRTGYTLQEKTARGEVVLLQDCACGERRSALKDLVL